MRYRTTIALQGQNSSRELVSQAWEDKVKVKFVENAVAKIAPFPQRPKKSKIAK